MQLKEMVASEYGDTLQTKVVVPATEANRPAVRSLGTNTERFEKVDDKDIGNISRS